MASVAGFKRELIGTEFKDMDKEKWMNVIRRALAELFATATLMFIGCMGLVGGLSHPPDHFAVALNFGIAVMAGLIVRVLALSKIQSTNQLQKYQTVKDYTTNVNP